MRWLLAALTSGALALFSTYWDDSLHTDVGRDTCRALVLGAALVPVMEYDSDVPQFSALWYLPIVSAGVTLAVMVIRRFDPRPGAVFGAALLVTAVRLLTVAFLALLGHSTPIVPPVLLVTAAVDLVHLWRPSPWWLALVAPAAVHATYVPLLPVVPHGTAVPPIRSFPHCCWPFPVRL
ncbi:hypothetical protein [Streptomyces chiangmaiensis]|uniref:Uncharacterized protein n=1 Tax=Streptomyces chiangmaiensis TaxID=766497 RepID=A0ABU7FVA9_9ACTN|nr:hypothetical protein [Streptomyces chiangmaiensis]MED7827797.1 hypothetical protein [Streptomyces chiangmaiensis]